MSIFRALEREIDETVLSFWKTGVQIILFWCYFNANTFTEHLFIFSEFLLYVFHYHLVPLYATPRCNLHMLSMSMSLFSFLM